MQKMAQTLIELIRLKFRKVENNDVHQDNQ